MIILMKTSEGFVWMPIRRCTICGQENPDQLKKCIEQKEKGLAEFLKNGGELRAA